MRASFGPAIMTLVYGTPALEPRRRRLYPGSGWRTPPAPPRKPFDPSFRPDPPHQTRYDAAVGDGAEVVCRCRRRRHPAKQKTALGRSRRDSLDDAPEARMVDEDDVVGRWHPLWSDTPSNRIVVVPQHGFHAGAIDPYQAPTQRHGRAVP